MTVASTVARHRSRALPLTLMLASWRLARCTRQRLCPHPHDQQRIAAVHSWGAEITAVVTCCQRCRRVTSARWQTPRDPATTTTSAAAATRERTP